MKLKLTHDLHPITDALRWLEMHQENRVPDDYSSQEMKEMKRECSRLANDVCWLPDLHRAVVAQRNNWNYSAGRADRDQAESWQREWEEYIAAHAD